MLHRIAEWLCNRLGGSTFPTDSVTSMLLQPFVVDEEDYLAILVSGGRTEFGVMAQKGVKLRTATFVMPRESTPPDVGMLFCVVNNALVLGAGQGKTIAMDEIDWENVFILYPLGYSEIRNNPIAYRKTYNEIGITGPAYILSEMIPHLETMIREHVNPPSPETEE